MLQIIFRKEPIAPQCATAGNLQHARRNQAVVVRGIRLFPLRSLLGLFLSSVIPKSIRFQLEHPSLASGDPAMSIHKALAIGFGFAFIGIANSVGAAPTMPPSLPRVLPAQVESANPSHNRPPVAPPAETAPRAESTTGMVQAKPSVPAANGGALGGVAKGEIRIQKQGAAQAPAPIIHLDPSAAPKVNAGPQAITPRQSQ